MNLSRALTLSIKSASGGFKLLSSGRVQGPALKLLYDREQEIKAFKPEPYWELPLLAATADRELLFWHQEEKFTEKKKAEDILKRVQGKKAVVQNTEKRESKQKAPHPFDLTSLQIEAYSVLGISPHRTLQLAQDLYSNGWISYPRTSSQKLPESIQYKKILEGLKKQFSKEVEFLLKKGSLKPTEGTKTDPAHPAIYPTGILPKTLESPASKLYELIVRRFFAVFGEDAKRETVTLSLDVNKEVFITKGTRTIEEGWFALYRPFVKLDEEELPSLNIGDELKVKDVHLDEKFTQPPKRYTEASIIKELEKRNLGTKATRAQILQNLYDRDYVKDKSIMVTDLGSKIIETLQKYCPEILDEALTREFEEDMESILEHTKKGDQIIVGAKNFLEKTLKRFKDHEKQIGASLNEANFETREKENTLGVCHKCKEGNLMIRRGKFGSFAACSKYPECKTTYGLPKNGKILPLEKACPSCQSPMIKIIRARRKPQENCLNPDCPLKKQEEEKLEGLAKGKNCPNCGTALVLKKSFYGYFLACPGYPKCKHIENIKMLEKEEAGH
ncbi:DNA topoisomerase I [Candidatus Woesearchaeota archaeon]|nr:DNA topoisomerase I [Candidatus Woesearchaeota archaeon]